MSRNVILSVLTVSAALVLGVCIGASEYRFAIAGIKWTDVASLVITFAGLCLGLLTYSRWLAGKKRDDSYLVAKQYLNIFSEICEYVDELARQYDSMCPAPGVIGHSEQLYQSKLETVAHIREVLYLHKSKLANSISELHFWGVSLTNTFHSKHKTFMNELANIMVISDALNSQLYALLIQKRGNMNEVVREKKAFNGKHSALRSIDGFRTENGFDGVFAFKSPKKS